MLGDLCHNWLHICLDPNLDEYTELEPGKRCSSLFDETLEAEKQHYCFFIQMELNTYPYFFQS